MPSSRRSRRSRRRAAAPLVAVAAVGAALAGIAGPRGAGAYADGPPPAHTGGFGEPTCRACHFDAELNEPGGTLRLEGVPAAYEVGATYRLTVGLARPGLRRGGFELAVRHASGDHEGEQAGELRAVDTTRIEIVRLERNGVLYARHREAGTAPVAPDSARWIVEWTAPDAAEGVVFHVAANAANDDVSAFGDFIYTTGRAIR